jgi:hypothetical protein
MAATDPAVLVVVIGVIPTASIYRRYSMESLTFWRAPEQLVNLQARYAKLIHLICSLFIKRMINEWANFALVQASLLFVLIINM